MKPISVPTHLPQAYKGLAERLKEFVSVAHNGRLSLALQLGDDPLFLEYEWPETLRLVDVGQYQQVPAICLAKPLTASLLAELVSTGRADWASPVNEVLEVRGAAANSLAGITFFQLLNHTHGLDGSLIETVPRTAHGFIDTIALCQQLAPTPLSAPGELYSYNNTGSWLAAAALERLTDTPYPLLLSAQPYVAADKALQTHLPSSVCPATGGSLALTMSQWLSFAEIHTKSSPLSHDPAERSLASLRSAPVPLPGWSPSEQAACLGWKYYGQGWFGHTANMDTGVTYLRFKPENRIAIIMSATNDIIPLAITCLLREYFPELKGVKMPRRLAPTETNALQLDSYVGVYRQAKTQLRISRADKACLSFAVSSDEPLLCAPAKTLQAAENDIFFPSNGLDRGFPYLQFLRSSHCGDSFSYAWNGKHLWKRQ